MGRALCHAALLLIAAGSAGDAAENAAHEPLTVTGSAGGAVLSVTLDGPADISTFVLEGPDRLVVDLVTGRVPPAPARSGSPLVASVRTGLVAPGRVRLVLDLARPVSVARREVRPGSAPGTWLAAFDLALCSRAAFHAATAGVSAADPDTTGSLPHDPLAAPPRRPVIAIDAGHGGSDTGARARSGTLEKDLTLGFAQALRDALAASYDVVMIRDGDVFVPLDERVARARSAGANLLVSIHADSIARPSVAGATVYTGAERATDHDAARLAERENRADAAGAHAAPPPSADVIDILGDLTTRETRHFSHRFASLLIGQLAPVNRLNVEPHREAGFRVLRAGDLPAVLVELGYLSNAREAELMGSEAWRRRTVSAMARALDRFFAGRGEGHAAVSP